MKNKHKKIGSYLFLIILSFICIIPFYVMIINATHASEDIVTNFLLLPGKNIINNYHNMMGVMNPWKMLLNSLYITVPSTVLTAYIGALTAYGFSVYRFKGDKILFWIVLSTMMIPEQMLIIGIFHVFRIVGITNSFIPIIFPQVAKAATVFWLKGYLDQVLDKALLEAARVEGMGEFRIFHVIGLPLMKPGIATISIFNFVTVWNNFIMPLSMLSNPKKYPISMGIAIMRRLEPLDLGAVYVMLVISVIPILLIYMLFSKYIIGDVTTGAVKG